MFVKDWRITPGLERTRLWAGRYARGLGDVSPSTNLPAQSAVDSLTKQINDLNAKLQYLQDRWNADHYGGQTPEQMQAIIGGVTNQIYALQAQLQTAQSQLSVQSATQTAQQGTQAQIAQNTQLLTPQGPGVVISSTGPSQAQILRASMDAGSTPLSQPTSYAAPASSGLSPITVALLALGAFLVFKAKPRYA